MNNTVLSLYDYTGNMVRPWMQAGADCYIVDIQHPEGLTELEPGLTAVGFSVHSAAIHELVDMIKPRIVFGFPPCTDLAVSGAKWFESKRQADPLFQHRAAHLAQLVEYYADYASAPWMAENPVSVLSTLWRKPDYSFHPYEYGGYLPEDDVHPEYPEIIMPRDAYPKKTCLWTGNGFVMPEKQPVPVDDGYSLQHRKLGGKSLRTKNIRSATPRGFAAAVFEANKGVLR